MNGRLPSPSHRRPRGLRRGQRGFSLVELLVALAFISILLAGMLRVFAASLGAFASNQDALNANRAKRWALGQIEDDLQTGGYFLPVRLPPGTVSVDTTAGQNAVMLVPDQSFSANYYDAATGATSSETIYYDEIQYITDQPLTVRAALSASPTSNGSVTVAVASGALSSVQAGDYMVIFDSAFEAVQVSSVSGTTVNLNTSEGVDQYGNPTNSSAGLKSLTHQPGADVMFVRPMQVVRYTVMPLKLDSASTTSDVPCLVRDQQAYPSDGSRLTWPAATATAAQLTAAGVTRNVIVENVAGQPTTGTRGPTNYALRADMSVNNGTNWERGATWSATVTNLNSRLATVGQAPYTSITDASNPLWFRNIPALFRIDFTVRSAMQRQDPQNPTQRAYRYRSQTLMISPRNFSLGS